MRKVVLAVLAAAALAAPARVSAEVVYTFTALTSFGGDVMGSFVWTTPDFVSATANPLASQFDSCSVTFGGTLGVCRGAQFFPNHESGFDRLGFAVAPHDGDGAQTFFYFFQPGAFASQGGYHSTFTDLQTGDLLVSGSKSVVPEPAA